MNGVLRCFGVASPTYEVYYSEYPEPPEYGADFVMVYARTVRRAKVLAVQAWRRNLQRDKYVRRFPYVLEYPEENPFAGLTVEDLTDLPTTPDA